MVQLVSHALTYRAIARTEALAHHMRLATQSAWVVVTARLLI